MQRPSASAICQIQAWPSLDFASVPSTVQTVAALHSSKLIVACGRVAHPVKAATTVGVVTSSVASLINLLDTVTEKAVKLIGR